MDCGEDEDAAEEERVKRRGPWDNTSFPRTKT